jgi:hypothetical protein
MSTFEALSCSTRVSSSANSTGDKVRLLQDTSNKYSASQRHTFVLIAERLVLPNKFIALRLHILHFIMVLGEGAIELGLEHGVLLGLGEFFLQSLGPEHRVAKPLEHLGFLPGPLHDILQKAATT